MNWLEKIEAARSRPALRGWVKAVRWSMALIFIIPGFEKIGGELFRRAANEPGILPFFETLAATGLYWRFVGVSQIVAGTLLLFRRTALLGVLACVPIYANIMVLLLALPFDLPSIIAGAILCGINVGLLMWYAPELAAVVRKSPASEGSIRFGMRQAWHSAWFRRTILTAVTALVVVHALQLLDWI